MDKNCVTAVLRTRGSPDDHQTKVKRNGCGVFKSLQHDWLYNICSRVLFVHHKYSFITSVRSSQVFVHHKYSSQIFVHHKYSFIRTIHHKFSSGLSCVAARIPGYLPARAVVFREKTRVFTRIVFFLYLQFF